MWYSLPKCKTKSALELELAASTVWTWFKLILASNIMNLMALSIARKLDIITLPETSNLLNPNLQIRIVRKLTNWGFFLCCVQFILMLILALLVAWKFHQSSIAIAGVLLDYDSAVHFVWAFSIRYVRKSGYSPLIDSPRISSEGNWNCRHIWGHPSAGDSHRKSPVEIFPMGLRNELNLWS